MRIVALLTAALLVVGAGAPGNVSVAYAASLVRAIEGPVAAAFLQERGAHVEGEPGGSKALEHLIAAGVRTPDVFISADVKLLDALMRGPSPAISGYTTFGSARMVVAYSPKSPYAQQFADVGDNARNIVDVLLQPGVRVGRTDPRLDPKGARTLQSLTILGALDRYPDATKRLVEKAAVFPEEDLAVRVESDELDAGFFYSTEIPGRNLRVVELPGAANLSGTIAYGIAVLRSARDPQQARVFENFILHGRGRALLQSSGLRYFSPLKVTGTP